MDFNLTPEQEMVRMVARRFAEEVCEPRAAELDRTGEFPWDTFQQLTDCGLIALGFPKEYGGTGVDKVAQTLATEEIAKKCASTSSIYSIHQGAAWMIHLTGSKEQKEKYLRPLLTGGKVGAFALTEPDAGSDAGNVQTRAGITAKQEGDYYILNGSKRFISGGSKASIYTILAMTEPEKKVRGMSAFIVERDTPGFSIGKIEEKMGIVGSDTAELILEDVHIPKENLLGELNKGFQYALASIDDSRVSVGAGQSLGLAEGAFDLAVKYSRERVQFGKPIGYQQGIQWYLAEMKTKIEAARWLTYYAAWLVNQGKRVTEAGALAKLYASQAAREVVNLALQIHGGYGYMKDYPLERMYRDVKIMEIYEGTNEVMKIVLGRAAVGKL